MGRSSDGCFRWGDDRQRERGSFGVNLGSPIVTNGDFVVSTFRQRLKAYLFHQSFPDVII